LTVLSDWIYNILVKDENNYNSKLLKDTIGAVLESTVIRIRFVYESTGIVRFRIDCYKNKIRL